MTESPRRDEPTQRIDGGYGYTDPAYAGQNPYGPRPTEPLPAYPAYGYDPTGQYAAGSYGSPTPPPAPPEPPGTPRWLWIVAGIAVVTVVGLVIALVIVNSSQQQTVVAPVPTLSEKPTEPTMPTTPPTTTRRPTTTPRPVVPPTTTGAAPTTSATPGATETVTYDVTGEGRAINVTYVDDGGILQTEFNVLLPWSKTVALAQPAKQSASVSIINVGRQVSCSITISGATVRQRTGSGLTICSPIG